MAVKFNGSPRQAFTFDDVLIVPSASEVGPSDADVRTRITREIEEEPGHGETLRSEAPSPGASSRSALDGRPPPPREAK